VSWREPCGSDVVESAALGGHRWLYREALPTACLPSARRSCKLWYHKVHEERRILLSSRSTIRRASSMSSFERLSRMMHTA
jgi:hypothetical protein